MAVYPKNKFHQSLPPIRVWDENSEEDAKKRGYISDVYIKQAYPKMKYHKGKRHRVVNNADEEKKLGKGWADTPQDGNASHVDPATIAHEKFEREERVRLGLPEPEEDDVADVEEVEDVDPRTTITEKHRLFMVSKGYQVATVAEAQNKFNSMSLADKKSFLADFSAAK